MDFKERKRREWWVRVISDLVGDRTLKAFAKELGLATPEAVRFWLGRNSPEPGVSSVDPVALSQLVWRRVAAMRQMSVDEMLREMDRFCGVEVAEPGKQRALAAMTAIRSASVQEVPTMLEAIAKLMRDREATSVNILCLIRRALESADSSQEFALQMFADFTAPLGGETLSDRVTFLRELLDGRRSPTEQDLNYLIPAYQRFTGQNFTQQEMIEVTTNTLLGAKCDSFVKP